MPGSSHSELMPGSLLGKYRIERLLGHGGMATVYLAVQEGTGLEVALKVLMFRGESSRPGGDVARFIREARLAGGIRHPHWVSVYETGFDAKNNLYYIAMERMQASLANRLRAHGPLAEAEAIAVVEQIALALDKAFETQMVHRDIKPGNILYNAEGVCKLTDFGIAKSSRNEETQLTLREAVFGTPAYMSPEQATDARKVDARSDIYSLGTVFFELLSGERPYQGETPVQVLAQVITDKPPPDVRSKPKARKVHSDTAKLIMSMMAKNPAERPQTPEELIARIRALKARRPYAKPADAGEEPPYDDSTIMDPTNPPLSSISAVSAGTSASWSERATATIGASDGASTDTWRDASAQQRTAGNVPTFATQAVRDSTVATMATRTTVPEPNPAAHPAPKRSGKPREERGRPGKGWMVWTGILLLVLLGAGVWASSTDFVPKHAGSPGLVGSICRLIYRGDDNWVQPPPPPPPSPDDGPEGAVAPPPRPYLRFVTDYPSELWVTLDGEHSFSIKAGMPEEYAFEPGKNVEIEYYPLYNTRDYVETSVQPGRLTKVVPRGAVTNEVKLVLHRRGNAVAPSPATVVFHNMNPVPVQVKWEGIQPFSVAANDRESRELEPEAEISYTFTASLNSGDYEPGTGTFTAPTGGKTNDVELVVLKAKDSLGPQLATLTLKNQNALPVYVVLTDDNGTNKRWLMSAHSETNREIQTGIKTTVKYFSTNDRYVQDSTASAGTIIVTNQADLDLKLTEKEMPRLKVANDGEIPLVTSVKSVGDGRLLGHPGTGMIEAHKVGVFRDLPAGEELLLEYKVEDHPGYRGGTKRIPGLNWGDQGEATVRATYQNPPTLVVTNTGYRTMMVTISRNGIPVKEPFKLEGKLSQTEVFDEDGDYRVQTEAVTGRDDPSGKKEDYNSTDRTVSCEWGKDPVVVPCDANEKTNDNPSPVPDQDRFIQGALKEASRKLGESWAIHGASNAIGTIDQYLTTAKRFGDGTAVDSIVKNVQGVFAYQDWKTAVITKQKMATDEKIQAVIGDERWQHIEATTRASRSWKEFLDNY